MASLHALQSLIGLSPSSPDIRQALSALATSAGLPIIPKAEVKWYPDSVYFNYYELGLSLCFLPKAGAKMVKNWRGEQVMLDSIDIFNVEVDESLAKAPTTRRPTQKSYSPFPCLPFPLTTKFNLLPLCTGRDLVSSLLEPSKKTGGTTTTSRFNLPITLEWTSLGISIDLQEPEPEAEMAMYTEQEKSKGMGGVWDRAGRWRWKGLKIFEPEGGLKPQEEETAAIGYPSIDSVEGSASRNLSALTSALGPLINYTACTSPSPTCKILELASGTGEHVIGWAKEWSRTAFQPTERDEGRVKYIDESVKKAALPADNVLPAKPLDVLTAGDWSKILPNTNKVLFDGIIACNLLHCSPVETMDMLFKQAGPILTNIGWIAIYGAFLADDGSFSSEGDKSFNERFKGLDHSFGLRSVPQVNLRAEKDGFKLVRRTSMPAGNWFLVYERCTTPAEMMKHFKENGL